MKNLILVVVALLLFCVLAPVGVFYEHIINFKNLKKYYLRIAVGIDQLGNVVCAALFNNTLIKKRSLHKFGNEDETISSTIGKNKLAKTLTAAGKLLDKILELLDENHSIKYIEHDEILK